MAAVSVAALTIYDMCKAVDRAMVIERIVLEAKSGGRSGAYRRTDPESDRPRPAPDDPNDPAGAAPPP